MTKSRNKKRISKGKNKKAKVTKRRRKEGKNDKKYK